MRHPHEYKLIVHEEAQLEKLTGVPSSMLRLTPSIKVPDNYLVVTHLRGESIYNDNGLLKNIYKGLARYQEGV